MDEKKLTYFTAGEAATRAATPAVSFNAAVSSSIIITLLFFAALAYAEDSEKHSKIKIPPGMELKKIGDVNLLVPKGANLERKRDGLIYVEEEAAYFARKFLEVEERFKKIEEKEAFLETTIKDLEKRISSLEDNLPNEEAAEKEEEKDIREIIYE